MSRAYRIQISESLERVVHVDDGVATKIELLPVLPKERMRALLAEELAAAGLTVEDGVARRTTPSEDGTVTVEVEIETGTVTVRIQHETDVEVNAEVTRTVGEERRAAEEQRLRVDVGKTLERKIEEATEEMRKRATARLEGELKDARRELDRVVHRVTAAALKERAGQLGEIEELSEDDESLTIKVRV